jgi:hypothetical protein
VIVVDSRSSYPHVENAELVNYIIAAYCTVIDGQSGLSEPQKKKAKDG